MVHECSKLLISSYTVLYSTNITTGHVCSDWTKQCHLLYAEMRNPKCDSFIELTIRDNNI